jgi:hypothetical protein
MPEAYVQLFCPACEADWEERPNDLPAADEQFSCDQCRESRRTAEFMRTHRDLEILEEFHE